MMNSSDCRAVAIIAAVVSVLTGMRSIYEKAENEKILRRTKGGEKKNRSVKGLFCLGNVIFYWLDPDLSLLHEPYGLNCIHYASRRRQPTNFLTKKSDPTAILLTEEQKYYIFFYSLGFFISLSLHSFCFHYRLLFLYVVPYV